MRERPTARKDKSANQISVIWKKCQKHLLLISVWSQLPQREQNGCYLCGNWANSPESKKSDPIFKIVFRLPIGLA